MQGGRGRGRSQCVEASGVPRQGRDFGANAGRFLSDGFVLVVRYQQQAPLHVSFFTRRRTKVGVRWRGGGETDRVHTREEKDGDNRERCWVPDVSGERLVTNWLAFGRCLLFDLGFKWHLSVLSDDFLDPYLGMRRLAVELSRPLSGFLARQPIPFERADSTRRG